MNGGFQGIDDATILEAVTSEGTARSLLFVSDTERTR